MGNEIGILSKGEIAVFILPNGNPCYTISNGWQFRTVDKAVEKEKEINPGIEPKFIAFCNSGVEIDPNTLPVAKMGRRPDPNRPKKEKEKADPATKSENAPKPVSDSLEEPAGEVIITEEVSS